MLTKNDLQNMKLEDLKKVHMIGITSGISSFVATYLLNLGVEVTASEINQDNNIAKDWIERGVLYKGGHDSKYITGDLDLVVFPSGPIPGNPECEKTQQLGLSAIKLSEILGLISQKFKTIAVAGTHGKTTTAALITWLLYKEYRELPNFVIGDEILGINKSFNFNPHSEYLILEACEYKRQFLDRAPSPYITVITNVELDHTDYYKDQEDYNSAFKEFIGNTTDSVVVDKKGINIKDVINGSKVVDCNDIKGMYEEVTAELSGIHNHENVLRACGVAYVMGIFPDIEDFPGVASRFEYIGRNDTGSLMFLDYAHNPKKIRACLQEAKEMFEDKKIVLVWQPHSIERSISFKDDFAKSFDDADVVLIPNIFSPLREGDTFRKEMSDFEFVNYLKERNDDKDIRYTKDFEKTVEALKEFDEDSVLVFASAGDLKNIFKLMCIEK